ncbi:MAG: DUF11 domain-containing protein [Vicinamibacteria bacterium]
MMLTPQRCLLLLASATAVFLSAIARPASAQSSGGLTRLYLWPEERKNLIANPSLEQTSLGGPRDWDLIGSNWFLSSLQRRTGARSLQLRNGHLSTFTPLANQTLQLTPGWYNLRGYLKTQRAGSNIQGSGGRITLWKGNRGEATKIVAGTTGWTLVNRRNFLLPSGGSAHVRLEAYRKPDGDVFFEDVALHRLVPPFLDGFLLYPNYRGVLFQDRSQLIRMSVTAHPKSLGRRDGDFLVRLVLQNAAGATVSSVQRSVPSNIPTSISLDASKAPLGRLSLRLFAIDAGTRVPFFEYPRYSIVKSPASARNALKTYIDTDDTLVIQGQRRFALGIYDTSGRASDPAYYEPRIKKIAQAPFNLYLNHWLGAATKPQLSALTTTLRKFGMSYLHTSNAWYDTKANWPSGLECGGKSAQDLGQDPFTRCKARELRDVAGLAGWHTADEESADGISQVFGQYVLLRNNDPDGVTFIAQNRPSELTRWRDAADVIGVDPYPIYNIPLGRLSPFEKVLDWVDTAERSVHKSRPVWAVIQFFSSGANGHWPTYNELRSMSYMAIIGGARGLFYWSNGAGGLASVKDPVLKEQYWQRLVKVTKEIRELEPVLLSPNNSNVLDSVSDARIRVMTKRVGSIRYVFAVSRGNSTVRASFRLSQPASRAYVRGESRSLSVTGRLFADTFLPYAVHVYRIPAATSSTSTTTTIPPTTTTTVPPTTTTSIRTTTTTVSAGTADLMVRVTGPSSGAPGQYVAYTITVDNLGPGAAKGILISNTWSGSAQPIFISVNNPGCAPMSPTRLGCNLGGLTKVAAPVSVILLLRPSRTGTITNTVTVSYPSPPTDPNPGNNSSSVSTPIR